MPVYQSAHHPIDFLLFSVGCLSQNLMFKCLHFPPTARYLYDDEWRALQLGRCVLLFPVLIMC